MTASATAPSAVAVGTASVAVPPPPATNSVPANNSIATPTSRHVVKKKAKKAIAADRSAASTANSQGVDQAITHLKSQTNPQRGSQPQDKVDELTDQNITDQATRELGRAANGKCEPNLLVQSLSLPCEATQLGYTHPELCDGNNDANLVMDIEDAQSMYCANPPRIDSAKIDAAKSKVAQTIKNIALLPKKDQRYYKTITEGLAKNIDACVELSQRRAEQKISVPKSGGHPINVVIHGNLMMGTGMVNSWNPDTQTTTRIPSQIEYQMNDVMGFLDHQGANVCNLVLSGSRDASSTFNDDPSVHPDPSGASKGRPGRKGHGGSPPGGDDSPSVDPATDPVPPHGHRHRMSQ